MRARAWAAAAMRRKTGPRLMAADGRMLSVVGHAKARLRLAKSRRRRAPRLRSCRGCAEASRRPLPRVRSADLSQGAWSRSGFRLRFDWGPVGARLVGTGSHVLVIVDVLSFTTATTVAVERGAAVYPAATRSSATTLASEADAELAVRRRDVTPDHPWSLSPAGLRNAPTPARLVLPSPNGSAIASAADGLVVAACLRNASAVAAWLTRHHAHRDEPVTVIAAGERWPDGSLRPALEDLLGAGAVLAACAQHDGRSGESPEAASARSAYEGAVSVQDAVRSGASGIELADAGFRDDVDIAVDIDASNAVPVLTGGAFRLAAN
jgi:2-phosphosulfolactate phosphatase